MLEISQYQEVTCLRMGQPVWGKVQYWCASYLVDGLLIDSGCAHTAPELLEALGSRPVELVVNTHHHEDHVGGNALLARELGLTVLAPALTGELLTQPYEMYPYQMLMWGPAEYMAPGILPQRLEVGGRAWQVLETPGHSADHVTFWQPEQRWAMVGDLWVGAQPKTCRKHEDQPAVIDSLKALRALEPRVMFTGLGQVVEDAVTVLEGTIEWLEQMEEEILALGARGLDSERIVLELFGRESSLRPITQDQVSYENFVRSFLRGPRALAGLGG